MPAQNTNPDFTGNRQTYIYDRYVYNTMQVLQRSKRANTRMEINEKREAQLTSINALFDDGPRDMSPPMLLGLDLVVVISLAPILRRFQRRRQ